MFLYILKNVLYVVLIGGASVVSTIILFKIFKFIFDEVSLFFLGLLCDILRSLKAAENKKHSRTDEPEINKKV
jgi:hypothetical protein